MPVEAKTLELEKTGESVSFSAKQKDPDKKRRYKLLPYATFLTFNAELIQYPSSGKYLNSKNLIYGLKIGTMKNTGFFFGLMSNFNFNGAFNACKPIQTVGEARSFSYFEGIFGLTGRYCKPLSFHFGLGYFYNTINYKTFEDKWAHVDAETTYGPVATAGFMFHIHGFVITAEAVTNCNARLKEIRKAFGFGAKVGLGFCIPNKKGKKEQAIRHTADNRIKTFVPKSYIPEIIWEADAVGVNESDTSNRIAEKQEVLEVPDTLVNDDSVGISEVDSVAEIEESDGIIELTVTDADSNVYHVVKLGSQLWLAENLRTTKYPNGVPILSGDSADMVNACRYYPNGDSAKVLKYGYLYNWNALVCRDSNDNIVDSCDICPVGWHVPEVEEWEQLAAWLRSTPKYWCGGNLEYVAKALAASSDWAGDIGECTVGSRAGNNNSAGFGAMPAGFFSDSFNGFGGSTFFWSSTDDGDNAHFLCIYNNSSKVATASNSKEFGLSVRCVKNLK